MRGMTDSMFVSDLISVKQTCFAHGGGTKETNTKTRAFDFSEWDARFGFDGSRLQKQTIERWARRADLQTNESEFGVVRLMTCTTVETTELHDEAVAFVQGMMCFLPQLARSMRLATSTATKTKKVLLIGLLLVEELPKRWPKKSLVGVEDINSGEFDSVKSTILVWRKEEWRKVVAHELCHYFRLDIAFETREINALWRRPFEAVVEFCATLAMCVFYSESESAFWNNWRRQDLFGIWQVAKSYVLNTKSSPKTSFESYYIAKSWLWHNLLLLLSNGMAPMLRAYHRDKQQQQQKDEWSRMVAVRSKWLQQKRVGWQTEKGAMSARMTVF